MRLNISTTPNRVYRQILEVMRSIPPLDALRSRELDVLAMLMYYNYKYKSIEPELRWRIIYDSSTKKEMQQELNMSEESLNNNISLVRKAGLLDKKTGRIPAFLDIIADKNFIIEFNFNIHEEDI